MISHLLTKLQSNLYTVTIKETFPYSRERCCTSISAIIGKTPAVIFECVHIATLRGKIITWHLPCVNNRCCSRTVSYTHLLLFPCWSCSVGFRGWRNSCFCWSGDAWSCSSPYNFEVLEFRCTTNDDVL